MEMRAGFFDVDGRRRKPDERDPLAALRKLIDWEGFRHALNSSRARPRESDAGRKSFDVAMVSEALVPQHPHGLPDDEQAHRTRDRLSLYRLLGSSPEERMPDAGTIRPLRERLVEAEPARPLFPDFDLPLDAQGCKARKGRTADTGFVDAPRRRDGREQNAMVEVGKVLERFEKNADVERRKNRDARWAKKNDETRHGCKSRVYVDNERKLVRNRKAASAEARDSRVFHELPGDDGTQDVRAGSACSSARSESAPKAMGHRS